MKSFLGKHLNYSVFFIILFVLISIKIINPSFVKSVSYLSFDLYQKLFSEKKDSEVIIIDMVAVYLLIATMIGRLKQDFCLKGVIQKNLLTLIHTQLDLWKPLSKVQRG